MNLQSLRNVTMALLLLALVAGFSSTGIATAATIFESATLGPTGIPQGSVAATNVTSAVYIGVRFELTQSVITTQIGGHFVDQNNGTFFGAIVELDDEDDFPDSGGLSSSDVLGHAELSFPVPSDEVLGDLTLSLDPGWYALVFGSGLFGTTGDGAAPRNNTDIGDPSYIGFGPNLGWINLVGFQIPFKNHRFAVVGSIVPEPSAIYLVLIASLILINSNSSCRL